VRHHLVDILDPQQEFSLADYISAAEIACRDIVARGRIPLFVGGTGLYLRGVLRGLFEGPAADMPLRTRLEEQARIEGCQSLHDQLKRIDPDSASRLHPNDQRRVIRAIEVYELTGQPLSQLQQHGPRPIDERPKNVFWLSPPRKWLYQRIDARVVQMFDHGLIDEVRTLVACDRPLSRTASQALGYSEVIDWLRQLSSVERSRSIDDHQTTVRQSLEDVITLIQTRTRQFAKRQHTWFRNLEECHPIAILGTESADEVADRIISHSEESRLNSK
jgi:tRNA dimethylallyltransferase